MCSLKKKCDELCSHPSTSSGRTGLWQSVSNCANGICLTCFQSRVKRFITVRGEPVEPYERNFVWIAFSAKPNKASGRPFETLRSSGRAGAESLFAPFDPSTGSGSGLKASRAIRTERVVTGVLNRFEIFGVYFLIAS
jgi:hypothetical protein